MPTSGRASFACASVCHDRSTRWAQGETAVRIWYRVQNLSLARAFYVDVLGFTETFVADETAWVALDRERTEIALAEGDPQPEDAAGVAMIDVEDIKAERERLEQSGVRVGTVLELQGAMRLLDVYDLDGNRLQLAEEIP
jgi:predicted enzyme related to lactoylglutathione lyase